MIDTSFWQKRRVFLTGHTGFKGSWLCLLLSHLGCKIKGYSLEPNTTPNLFNEARISKLIDSEIGDIRNLENVKKSIKKFKPDIIIHMAAQPLVRYSYIAPVETYEVNVLGTAHVLEAALGCETVKSFVNVTTDKCYENKEWEWAYRENEPIGGHDPYSSSKGCSELITSSYRKSFYEKKGIGLASARAGNVIGGGDWAKDRLIPDILRAFEMDKPVLIRNPNSIRPWQHVLDPLSGYLKLAQSIYKSPKSFSGGWNFGPNEEDARPVIWILKQMVNAWPGAKWQLDKSKNNPHEANHLKLDISKAKTKLYWKPSWPLKLKLKHVVNWHRSWMAGEDMQAVTMNEIRDFVKKMELISNE